MSAISDLQDQVAVLRKELIDTEQRIRDDIEFKIKGLPDSLKRYAKDFKEAVGEMNEAKLTVNKRLDELDSKVKESYEASVDRIHETIHSLVRLAAELEEKVAEVKLKKL